jgi:hypothetical protein
VNEAAPGRSKAALESQWAAFEDSVQTYLEVRPGAFSPGPRLGYFWLARAAHDGEIALPRHPRGETRIEVHRRHQNLEAIGTEQPQAGGARGTVSRFRERPRTMSEAGGDDDGAAAPLAPEASTVSGTEPGGTAITTTSGVPAMASMDLCLYGGATATLTSFRVRRRPKSTVGAEESCGAVEQKKGQKQGQKQERKRPQKSDLTVPPLI